MRLTQTSVDLCRAYATEAGDTLSESEMGLIRQAAALMLRAERLVVLVGQKKAIAIAVRNVSGRRRWSKLSEWLRPKPPVSRQFGMAS